MNKMFIVASLLELKLDQEFKIKGEDKIFMLTKHGILSKKGNEEFIKESATYLENLLCGSYEIDDDVLSEEEKSYLSNIVKPFRAQVQYIMKDNNHDFENIVIKLDGQIITLPYFDAGDMYEKMEIGRQYTLDELRI